MTMALLKSEIMMCNLLKNYRISLVRSVRGLADSGKSVADSGKYASMSSQELLKNKIKLTNFTKYMLVWTGRYKNVAEVPEEVSFDTLQKSRSRMRIKLSYYMMGITILACIFMVVTGKQAFEAGESVSKMNVDWHKEYNEKSKAEDEVKKAKK